MTTPKNLDVLDVLMDAHLAELMDMSDEQVLDGADPASAQVAGLRMLDSAKAEAGRRRLAKARDRLVAAKAAGPASQEPGISPQVARAFLRLAANDGRYTLAARGLDEMSDDDAVRLYLQLKHLESVEDDSSDES